jgi:tRNA threonylcarbamoyladenosine biosynthesis protein TsaE
MTWQTSSTGSAETEALGERLGKLLKSPAVVELRSDLGGGKTTFVKGLARGLGSKDQVTSPTFTLNQIYQTKDSVKISHHDFYRLSEAGIMSDELAESLSDNKTVTVVEWGSIVENVLPEDRLTIEFRSAAASPDEREVIFTYPKSQAGLIRRLETSSVKIEP